MIPQPWPGMNEGELEEGVGGKGGGEGGGRGGKEGGEGRREGREWEE